MFKITPECDACGQCLVCCPVDGAIIEDNGFQINSALCAECGACVSECPQNAITEE